MHHTYHSQWVYIYSIKTGHPHGFQPQDETDSYGVFTVLIAEIYVLHFFIYIVCYTSYISQ